MCCALHFKYGHTLINLRNMYSFRNNQNAFTKDRTHLGMDDTKRFLIKLKSVNLNNQLQSTIMQFPFYIHSYIKTTIIWTPNGVIKHICMNRLTYFVTIAQFIRKLVFKRKKRRDLKIALSAV